MYPTKIEANGNIYEINTDYRVAEACFKAINDKDISDLERFYAVETLLLGENVLSEDENILKDKIGIYLRCGEKENIKQEEKDMDYIKDKKRIKTSIRQVYNNLDIEKLGYLHWWEYNELISGLTSDSLLNKIRELRTYDINEISDEKEKQRIIEAKAYVSLEEDEKLSEKEIESINKFKELAGII